MSVRVGTLRLRVLAGAVVCVAAVAATPARAQQPERPAVDTTVTKVHVVKRGDTLWDLSNYYLGSPWIWQRIYERNRSLIKNPHWIYPGQKFDIPALIRAAAELAAEDARAQAADTAGARTRFWHAGEGLDATGAKEAPRPVVERGEFLAAPWLQAAASLPAVGRMLDRVRVEGNAEKLAQLAILPDRVYVRAEPGLAAPAVGSELLLVNVTRPQPPFGDVVEPTALLRVERSDAGVAVASIVKQYGMVLQGQRALAVPAFQAPAATAPQPVARGPEGELVAFVHQTVLHTTADIGFVSLGRPEGLEIGDELLVYAPRRTSGADANTELPAEEVARLRVLKVGDHTSTVRVLSMRQPALQAGLLVRVVARVP